MRRLHRLLHLPMAERWLLAKAVCLLVAIRLGLRLLPFNGLRRVLAVGESLPPRRPGADPSYAARAARAVERGSRRLPGVTTCLAKALAVQFLLTRQALAAELHIGVVHDADGQFQAHAWVESGGAVIIGGTTPELAQYQRLAVLDGVRS